MMKRETITRPVEALAKATASIIARGGDAQSIRLELAQNFTDFTHHMERSVGASTAIDKTAYGLAEGVAKIINGNADEEDKSFALANAFAQCEHDLERHLGIGKERVETSRKIVFDKIFDGGGEIAKARTRHDVSPHGLAAAATEHVLDMLDLHRRRLGIAKGDDQLKEKSMHTNETLSDILKDFGPIKICKHIVDAGKTGYDEHTLVSALTKHVASQHPELRPDVAFSKLYESEEVVRRACAIAKAMPFVADLTPAVVGGVDAMHAAVSDTESSEAYAQLQELGRRKWPTASEAVQFANAITDPKNGELARKAHRRPTAPANGAYPFPR
jgi:hypothetical protein